MPKFTVTTDNSDGEHSEEPIHFPSTKAATDDAQVALAEMAREKLPDGKHADFGVKVEDEGGTEIYRAGLSFNAKTADDIRREDQEADAAADDVANSLGGLGPRE
ncbi:hypothetical protein ASE63_26315 [Bosea sp. Root381]|uniref:DUF6894 family protein n=1 Tax=Bosea sp. Root381 TaxID=1736524 RepID=UPI0006F4B8B9|nr:hypothetical protein [Bosea sp. Root381]KRE00642.1 hypothetical protein ASE63_26315 [Bosea sp. Root381]